MKFINFDDIVNKNNENYINTNQYSHLNMFQIQLLLEQQDVVKQLIYYLIF